MSLQNFVKVMQIGQGAYGDVWLAEDIVNGRHVALKKLKFNEEREGFPKTSVREITLLQSLRHENIVELLGIVFSKPKKHDARSKGSIWMVFEYLPFDLSGYTEALRGDAKEHIKGNQRTLKPEKWLAIGEIKHIMLQLLKALDHCHKNNIMHRDLKTANLLMDSEGNIKLADFGLARLYNTCIPTFTNRVITLWYRPPELLLGSEHYTTSVDIWSAGCILGELLCAAPIFTAEKESHVLKKIVEKLGMPDEEECRELRNLSLWNIPESNPLHPEHTNKLAYRTNEFKMLIAKNQQGESLALDLLLKMLRWNPKDRLTADEAMNHEWFSEVPLPEPLNFRQLRDVKTAHSYMTRQKKQDKINKPPPKKLNEARHVNAGEVRLNCYLQRHEERKRQIEAMKNKIGAGGKGASVCTQGDDKLRKQMLVQESKNAEKGSCVHNRQMISPSARLPPPSCGLKKEGEKAPADTAGVLSEENKMSTDKKAIMKEETEKQKYAHNEGKHKHANIDNYPGNKPCASSLLPSISWLQNKYGVKSLIEQNNGEKNEDIVEEITPKAVNHVVFSPVGLAAAPPPFLPHSLPLRDSVKENASNNNNTKQNKADANGRRSSSDNSSSSSSCRNSLGNARNLGGKGSTQDISSLPVASSNVAPYVHNANISNNNSNTNNINKPYSTSSPPGVPSSSSFSSVSASTFSYVNSSSLSSFLSSSSSSSSSCGGSEAPHSESAVRLLPRASRASLSTREQKNNSCSVSAPPLSSSSSSKINEKKRCNVAITASSSASLPADGAGYQRSRKVGLDEGAHTDDSHADLSNIVHDAANKKRRISAADSYGSCSSTVYSSSGYKKNECESKTQVPSHSSESNLPLRSPLISSVDYKRAREDDGGGCEGIPYDDRNINMTYSRHTGSQKSCSSGHYDAETSKEKSRCQREKEKEDRKLKCELTEKSRQAGGKNECEVEKGSIRRASTSSNVSDLTNEEDNSNGIACNDGSNNNTTFRNSSDSRRYDRSYDDCSENRGIIVQKKKEANNGARKEEKMPARTEEERHNNSGNNALSTKQKVTLRSNSAMRRMKDHQIINDDECVLKSHSSVKLRGNPYAVSSSSSAGFTKDEKCSSWNTPSLLRSESSGGRKTYYASPKAGGGGGEDVRSNGSRKESYDDRQRRHESQDSETKHANRKVKYKESEDEETTKKEKRKERYHDDHPGGGEREKNNEEGGGGRHKNSNNSSSDVYNDGYETGYNNARHDKQSEFHSSTPPPVPSHLGPSSSSHVVTSSGHSHHRPSGDLRASLHAHLSSPHISVACSSSSVSLLSTQCNELKSNKRNRSASRSPSKAPILLPPQQSISNNSKKGDGQSSGNNQGKCIIQSKSSNSNAKGSGAKVDESNHAFSSSSSSSPSLHLSSLLTSSLPSSSSSASCSSSFSSASSSFSSASSSFSSASSSFSSCSSSGFSTSSSCAPSASCHSSSSSMSLSASSSSSWQNGHGEKARKAQQQTEPSPSLKMSESASTQNRSTDRGSKDNKQRNNVNSCALSSSSSSFSSSSCNVGSQEVARPSSSTSSSSSSSSSSFSSSIRIIGKGDVILSPAVRSHRSAASLSSRVASSSHSSSSHSHSSNVPPPPYSSYSHSRLTSGRYSYTSRAFPQYNSARESAHLRSNSGKFMYSRRDEERDMPPPLLYSNTSSGTNAVNKQDFRRSREERERKRGRSFYNYYA